MELRGLEWTEEEFLSFATENWCRKSVKQNQNVALTRLSCLTLLTDLKY